MFRLSARGTHISLSHFYFTLTFYSTLFACTQTVNKCDSEISCVRQIVINAMEYAVKFSFDSINMINATSNLPFDYNTHTNRRTGRKHGGDTNDYTKKTGRVQFRL